MNNPLGGRIYFDWIGATIGDKNMTGHKSVLLIGIEFVEPLFSGNGILTHSIILGLLRRHFHITVICARPENVPFELSTIFSSTSTTAAVTTTTTTTTTSENENVVNDDNNTSLQKKQPGRLRIFDIPVSASSWKRLDKKSAWEEMSQKAPTVIPSSDSLGSFDYILGVDWSAYPTYQSLRRCGTLEHMTTTRYVNMVFRVFSRSRELFDSRSSSSSSSSYEDDDDDERFYATRELEALSSAAVSIVLSHVDESSLVALIKNEDCRRRRHRLSISQSSSSSSCPSSTTVSSSSPPSFHILVPPLRDDIVQYLLTNPFPSPHQVDSVLYLTCNVRLSPEKNAITFARIISILHSNGTLQKYNLTPLLIGTICDETYATAVQNLLPPSTKVITTFLQPPELLSYLHRSVLLIHPPVYDAYGMIVAEAASVGTPAMIHRVGVGVRSLLEEEEVLVTDMGCVDVAAEDVARVLEQKREVLREVGDRARMRVMGWGVDDYVGGLVKRLKGL